MEPESRLQSFILYQCIYSESISPVSESFTSSTTISELLLFTDLPNYCKKAKFFSISSLLLLLPEKLQLWQPSMTDFVSTVSRKTLRVIDVSRSSPSDVDEAILKLPGRSADGECYLGTLCCIWRSTTAATNADESESISDWEIIELRVNGSSMFFVSFKCSILWFVVGSMNSC